MYFISESIIQKVEEIEENVYVNREFTQEVKMLAKNISDELSRLAEPVCIKRKFVKTEQALKLAEELLNLVQSGDMKITGVETKKLQKEVEKLIAKINEYHSYIRLTNTIRVML